MNGVSKGRLDEDAFGEKGGLLKTFDAFRTLIFFFFFFVKESKNTNTIARRHVIAKTKPSYTAPSRRGGQWTVVVLTICALLSLSELHDWIRGTENHQFSVEKGMSNELQLNLDMVIHMPCESVRVNIQDASGDRILAGELLKRDTTSWQAWADSRHHDRSRSPRDYQTLSQGQENSERLVAQEEDANIHHVMGEVRRNPWRKFPKGPKIRRSDTIDSCRVYGSLEGNKVQGDFHITARGHGYQEFGQHLDHKCMCFAFIFFFFFFFLALCSPS